jgi:hypothetical protein
MLLPRHGFGFKYANKCTKYLTVHKNLNKGSNHYIVYHTVLMSFIYFIDTFWEMFIGLVDTFLEINTG